ncbi:glycosyltransferase family 4 protein [Halalkalibacter krulwichiae]|uniref:D-inositol 3-phosphate glycosyltransferase n=1 Tax=Halalkalibacter krulwichiae TaxID=199441 RepID=A0A1X9M5Y0_9BACI|nr:glycosyltransferase family 4 protein [Halalkalibacter krulwichiae]ARK28849.1 D-inositol 3-phosphate glycosyltransferase [Halalkalibacter krulwichiae]
MKILVIWRLLTVGGVNAGWRNRAIYLKKHGITTDFLYCKDLGGLHMMEDVSKVYLTKDKKKIIEIIKNNNYDAIIVVDTSQAYTWLKKAEYSGPIIIEARTPEITKLKRNLEGYKQIKPQKFIVPSEYQKRVLSIVLDEPYPIEVINNSTDISFFKPNENTEISMETEPILPKDKKVVAYIGRLDERKNWRLLLKVANMVRSVRDDIEFWVIGGAKSVERELFEDEWKNQNLTEVVKWFPVIPYQQMPAVYGKIKQSGGCLFAATKAESFGNTFIEAMGCGVPVVAPGISSIPEIVKDGKTGCLYREEHVRAAAQQIYRVLDNTHLYEKFSNNARNRVVKKYSLSECTNKYIELLKEVTKEVRE